MTVSDAIYTPAGFAAKVLGQPLWDHQIEISRSRARYRVITSGRQSGKSRELAVEALTEAISKPGAFVLLISAGEEASKRLLADCSGMANRADGLRPLIVEDSKSLLSFSNGSRILSVPASDKQIRGWSVDLLIVDEAAFVSEEIWQGAEPSISARPGSRVILCSSPWGGPEHWFRQMWNRGMTGSDPDTQAWHWPSTISPMMDLALIERWRETWPAHKFATEIMAEWTDGAGSYFTQAEIDNSTAAYICTDANTDLSTIPRGQLTAGGVDWGFRRDANVLALIGVLDDGNLNFERSGDRLTYYVPHLEAHHQMGSDAFIDRMIHVAKHYEVFHLVSESNGVGQFPTDTLRQRARIERYTLACPTGVSGVTTTQRRKMNGFGALKVLMEQGRIVLPNHPELLKQLYALEFTQSQNGLMSISVPESLGHDDLAMGLMQAASTISTRAVKASVAQGRWGEVNTGTGQVLTTGGGTRIREHPRCLHYKPALRAMRQESGNEKW